MGRAPDLIRDQVVRCLCVRFFKADEAKRACGSAGGMWSRRQWWLGLLEHLLIHYRFLCVSLRGSGARIWINMEMMLMDELLGYARAYYHPCYGAELLCQFIYYLFYVRRPTGDVTGDFSLVKQHCRCFCALTTVRCGRVIDVVNWCLRLIICHKSCLFWDRL